MPFAAFFVAFLLLLCIPRRSRKLAVCLLLGALAGLCAVYTTSARLERARTGYAGRTVLLTAEVERADSSYFSDTVDATLWVESVNGRCAGFRITCAELPACAAGQRVQGWFALQQPDMEEQTAQYADGIALQAESLAEKPQFTVLGESGSFRARTHRLQQKLSESLRREMHRDTGGVLAAMTVGDRSGLSAQLRSAYRGAGLSHVLVVSGMHVSILCGDILSVLLPYRWEQSYRRRRRRTVWKSLLALVLMGVTGFTPSVRRAAVAVWVSALGVWVWGPADTLTSLAAAGILMTAVNSYAVWDIGFELSFAAAVGIGLGNALSRDVVHIDLVGSAQAPAVVIAQNDRAVVLFRGGSAAQRAVENQLARRGVRTVELVADLRMNAKTACTLPAQQGIRAERLPVNASRKLRCTPAAVELLRTREGCLVRLSIGNRQFVTLSGRAELAQPLQTEWLIATPKKPETVRYQKLLALRSYSWMPPETQYTSSLSLRRTGGERLG